MKHTQSDVALIRRSHLFHTMNDETLNFLMKDATIRSFKRNEMLFIQGDKAVNFYVVLDGWVKLFRLSPAGTETIMSIFTSGESFAEAASFIDGYYPVSAEAVTDSRLLLLPAVRMISKIMEKPELSLSLLAATSAQMHKLIQQIEQLKSHTGAQRLAEFLVSLCREGDDACHIELPYDKTLIAGKLGMKPESLSRAFAKLKTVGLKVEQNIAYIENTSQLRDFIDRNKTTD